MSVIFEGVRKAFALVPFRPRGGLPGVLLAALLASACASAPQPIPISAVVPPGTADFALDPIPTPAHSRLTGDVLPVGRVHVSFLQESEPATTVLERLFPHRVVAAAADTRVVVGELRDAPSESFRIVVRPTGSGVEIDLDGADAEGRLWAAETLRQLVVESGGTRYVREGSIDDHPAFPLRGSKRPLPWEVQYRANFAYQKGIGRKDLPGRIHFVAVDAPGGTLDATKRGVGAVARFFRKYSAKGVERFALAFDDVGFGMTPETRDRFGTYPRAISHFLHACRAALETIAPKAVLYWLPQTYFTKHPLFRRFANDIGVAGGIPPDVGLVLTGPNVVSRKITAGEIAAARRSFGSTETKVLIYDNYGRDGDHGALPRRDPALATQAAAVFGERGEPLMRITRLDATWNPKAYDPRRSHLLACREIVGAAAARPLSHLILDWADLDEATRRSLFLRVKRLLDPPPRAPVPAGPLLDRIWLDLSRRSAVGASHASSEACRTPSS